ncbi:hypothetical protein [Amycolatopsis sp. DSM 110486]|uniref:hypothetical protein n=1 Tax=Amycolatopsis sp. DSM 110486 TaxID=2865832 RepID=UPI001C6A1B79|nr:hypothetical protein [Amycolatopsis sp. DSM 110486]QYN26648.1 hypothetical protein K1T34_34920 [Amycolatopsis sp. DSM 110486]
MEISSEKSEAPRIDADGHLSSTESADLYRHYGLPMPRTAPDVNAGRDKMDTAAGRSTQDAAMAREGRSVADAGSGTRGEETVKGDVRKEQFDLQDDAEKRKH